MQRLLNMKVTRIDNVSTIFSQKGRYYETRQREHYGISFCISGKIIYYHGDREIVSEPGTVVLLPKGAAYSLVGTSTGEFTLINFDCETTTPISEFMTLEVDNQDRYLKCFTKMKEFILFENSQLKMMETFYKMLNMLVMDSNQKNYSLMPVVSYIESNYSDSNLSNSALAERLNISEVYMRRLFKKQFGTTPKQYILDIRLQRAAQLLTQTGLTVTEISTNCGFSSLYHFSRAFKNKLGETPLEYRARYTDDMSIL